MSLSTAIYLISLADNFKSYAIDFLFISVVAGFGIFIIYILLSSEIDFLDEVDISKIIGYVKVFCIIYMLVFIVNMFIPKRDDMYLILGASKLTEFTSNEQNMEIYNKSKEILLMKLNEIEMEMSNQLKDKSK